jgi:hypothetical protein
LVLGTGYLAKFHWPATNPNYQLPITNYLRPQKKIISLHTRFASRDEYNHLTHTFIQGGIMAAQPQTFQQESRNISQAFLPEFDHEMANTRKSLERVPEDKLSFEPHTKSMTLGSPGHASGYDQSLGRSHLWPGQF